jgi:DNA-binding response OmpR family regulator
MRLLIAHKSSTARAALIDVVPRDGHAPPEIVEAEDGHEALDLLLGDDAPGLAFVDWDLPGIEGPELCRLVRDFHLSIPPSIVVLAGSRHADTRDAYGAGASHCVSTPASPAAIRAGMEAGLRAARERRASDQRDDRSSVRPSLEAVRTYETDSASFFDFAAADAGFDTETRPAVKLPRPTAGPLRRPVIEAVLHPS